MQPPIKLEFSTQKNETEREISIIEYQQLKGIEISHLIIITDNLQNIADISLKIETSSSFSSDKIPDKYIDLGNYINEMIPENGSYILYTLNKSEFKMETLSLTIIKAKSNNNIKFELFMEILPIRIP